MRGLSTLELLIAMAILAVVLASVVLVSFGDQSLLAEGGASDEALEKAQELLAAQETNARQDFRLLTSTSSTDGIYQTSTGIEDWPEDPYTVKRVNVRVAWNADDGVSRVVTLTQLVSDISDPDTPDTCDTFLTGNWQNPAMSNYLLSSGQLLPAFAPSGHSFSSLNPISAIDAYNGMLYVAVASTSLASNDTLFVFDISNPARPLYRGSIDNNPASTKGGNAIGVEGTSAFIVNGFASNFKTCKQAANCAQLQIFDVSNPADIPAPIDVLLPTTSPAFITGSGGQASGNALFYKGGYVYLGLQKTASGPEFNIIDVSNPANPHWIGGYQAGNTINQIYVRGPYAYLATDDKSNEFLILDISNPSNPVYVGSFDPKNTSGYETGQSMYIRGNDAFVGMAYASGSPEVYDLDISNPASVVSKGAYTIGSTIAGLFMRNDILFALASTIGKFESLTVSDSGLMTGYAPPVPLTGTGGAIDCEGNYFYVGTNAPQGNLTIMTGT